MRKAFAATATPALAKSLLKRPPRLPANVKVPKAKVLNIVAGALPRRRLHAQRLAAAGRVSPASCGCEMEKLKGEGWRVTNVLG